MKYILSVYEGHSGTNLAFSITINAKDEKEAIQKGKDLAEGSYFKLTLF